MCFNAVYCESTNSWSLTSISVHEGGKVDASVLLSFTYNVLQ